MRAFVDTSALFAVVDADDEHHEPARQTWTRLISDGTDLVVTNYVLLETFSLLQRRLGMAALRTFQQSVDSILHTEWVTEDLHTAGMAAFLAMSHRRLSLVDCVSFAAMRRLGIEAAFVFDRHFADQGFLCIPPIGDNLAEMSPPE
jgi:predicted nucleic acid-binding protein